MSAIQRGMDSIDSVRDLFEESLEEFVMERSSMAREEPAMSLAMEILMAGGKRYRPILGLLAYEASGGEDISEAMGLALSAELLHTATLIHDDIYDQTKTRRGRPTLHSSHGLAHAIIAGDYLFVLGFELGAKHSSRIVKIVAESCAGIASGELKQFRHIGDLATTPEDYYTIIDGKTAGPFSAGCECSAIIAGANEDDVTRMRDFGMEMGRAFQIVDDLLDLTGDESMGKPRGTDVHEGKMTLPLIHALTMLHGSDREQLADVLVNFSDRRWGELIELIEKSGSLDYARQLICNHLDRGLGLISELPESRAREMLSEIVEISRNRES